MSAPVSRALHWYARLVVLAVFLLIFVGAMVTSRGAGLSVPDWPLSFGSLNPPQYLQDIQVFWEHSHRLIGGVVGLLVIGLAVWLTVADPRRWVKVLGWCALAAVVLQGVLGGLRVLEKSVPYAIVHGCLAQAVMCMLLLIAIVTSPGWTKNVAFSVSPRLPAVRSLAYAMAGAVYIQLILGAVMRHTGAGLALQGFPQSERDGSWLPHAWSAATSIHFAHRAWACVVIIVATVLLILVKRVLREFSYLRVGCGVLHGLLLVQVILGANIIWHLRPFTITSLHVLFGASILATTLYLAAHVTALGRGGYLLAEGGAK